MEGSVGGRGGVRGYDPQSGVNATVAAAGETGGLRGAELGRCGRWSPRSRVVISCLNFTLD